jgi:hemolysin III
MKTVAHQFPSHTKAERRMDGGIHMLGIVAAPIASLWLLDKASGTILTLSLIVYCVGLIATLVVSALYNMLPPRPLKEYMRRLDHATIFVMIAGTYTPLLVNRLRGYDATVLGAFEWVGAAAGIILALAYPHSYQRVKLALYFLLGWIGLTLIGPLESATREATVILLFMGGAVYSAGTCVHLLERVRFHNAIWHALVLLAASLHFLAFATEFAS